MVIGGTIVTDTAALLVLAICVSIHIGGFSAAAIGLQLLALALYIPAILVGLSWLTRWLLDRLGASDVNAMIVLLLVVFVGASTAELIGLEGIIGAFLTGLAVNRALTGTPAKEKIEFFGNILFVPIFFLVMGVNLDLGAFARTLQADLPFVAAIVATLFVAKWLAAALTGWVFRYAAAETLTMWSLSLPQVAAALVAYETINGAGERLINELALNSIIVLMVVTSILGPTLTERFAKRLSSSEASE